MVSYDAGSKIMKTHPKTKSIKINKSMHTR